MKITVTSVDVEDGWLRVRFDHDVRTQEGRRALRILCKHARSSRGDTPDANTITVPFERKERIRGISSRAKCQSEMDRYVNWPISPRLERLRVHAYGAPGSRQSLLNDMQALRAAQAAGHNIKVRVCLRLIGLPIIEPDIALLRELTPGVIQRDKEDPHKLWIEFELKNELATLDPWKWMVELERRVVPLIV